MSLNSFIPEVWSAKVLIRLRKLLAFAQVVNTDYQGEISQFGDTVHINEIGDVTIRDYTRNSTSDLTEEYLTDAQKTLKIDQGKYFNFLVDDLDRAQMQGNAVDKAIDNAVYGIAKEIDTFIAGKYTEAGIMLGSYSISDSIVLKMLARVKQEFMDNGWSGPIWGVVAPWFFTKVAEKIQTVQTDNQRIIQNGVNAVTTVDGITLLPSTNLSGFTSGSTSALNRMMFGSERAITYAGQVSTIEALRDNNKMADKVRGLYLYGAKVVRPNELCTLSAYWVDNTTST